MLTRTTVAALLALSLSVTLVTAAKADDPQWHGCICVFFSCYCW